MSAPPVALDAEVQRLLATGDGAAAATVVIEQIGPGVLRYLRSLLRDEEDAADAFSAFAENVWRGLPGFRFDASLRTWCYRIGWNAAVNLSSETWRKRRQRLDTGAASRLADSIRTKSAVRVARQVEALDRLRRALTQEEQSLLALRVDQGFSWGEIAEILSADGAPVQANTVTKRFERLKAKLAELARAEGLVD
jgi:RNA polymerase sigma-70 factor (ECF subfamily)